MKRLSKYRYREVKNYIHNNIEMSKTTIYYLFLVVMYMLLG